MRQGKLNQNEIREALKDFKIINSEVKLGAAIGEDCAVIEYCGKLLLSTDPITGECVNIEELAVNINANDIYASGGIPFAALATVLAPTTESADRVLATVQKLGKIAAIHGIDIVGGHTEFTDAVNRTIVSLAIIGKIDNIDDAIINRPQLGDSVIVTKYLGLEATKILVGLNLDKYDITIAELEALNAQSLSIKDESLAIRHLEGINTMHDITEGGIFGACCEIANPLGLGVELYQKEFPILPATAKVCIQEGFDIGYTISSGALLITTNREKEVLKALLAAGVKATVVGKITNGVCKVLRQNGVWEPINTRCDELFVKKE